MSYRLALTLAATVAAFSLGGCGKLEHPSLKPYAAIEAKAPAAKPALRAKFLGTATVVITDGQTTLMTDGFLSRPSMTALLFNKLNPDLTRIDAALARASVAKADAIFVGHSHVDHVLDTAAVAERTGAMVYGSPSTRNVVLGYGLADNRMHVFQDGETIPVGAFTVQVFRTPHSPNAKFQGEITAPLAFPAKADAFKEGGSYSFLIRHGDVATLIVPSANFTPGKFQGVHVDAVFLATGALGMQSEAFADAYWREAVTGVGAKRVIPIHWDDFDEPLDKPLVPLRGAFDKFDTGMAMVMARARRDGVKVELPVAFQDIDLAAR